MLPSICFTLPLHTEGYRRLPLCVGPDGDGAKAQPAATHGERAGERAELFVTDTARGSRAPTGCRRQPTK